MVSTTGKGGYTAAIQNIYGVPPPPPADHHEAIYNLNTSVQGMQTHSYDLEELALANAFHTSSNSEVMAQLEQMTVTMNAMQAQLKILLSPLKNQTRTKMKYYCRSCGSN